MRRLVIFFSRLFGTLRSGRFDRELHDELQFHLEMETEENLRRGMSPDDARAAARRSFGGVDQVRETWRDRRGLPWLDHLVRDLRLGLRMLHRYPTFTAVAVVTLALGIGANTAIFSAVNAVLLRPLPFADAERLVALWETSPRQAEVSVSYPNFLDWQAAATRFEAMTVIDDHEFTLTGGGEPERIPSARVSADFFGVLGVQPLLGRSFVAADDRPGEGRVVLLGHDLWQRRFGGSPDVVGTLVTLNDISVEVVGVLPPALDGQSYGWFMDVKLWAPLGQYVESWGSRGAHNGPMAIGRLATGASVADAQAELDVVAERLERAYPESNTGVRVIVRSLGETIVADRRGPLLLLFGAVGFVLLIACANVANLLLARGTGRARELALRVALGATPMAIVRLLLVESVCLAALGGGSGLLLAFWVRDALVGLAPVDLARGVVLDVRVLGFAAAISLASGALFGVVPAWRAAHPDLESALKDEHRSTPRGQRHVRSLIVVAETALAAMLLVGAGLLVRSVMSLQQVDPGFDRDRMLTMHVTLPLARYPDIERQTTFYRDVLARIARLPGVTTVGAGTDFPILEDSVYFPVHVDGHPVPPPGQELLAYYRAVTPGYLPAMGIPILVGRGVDELDVATSQPVVVVNEAIVRRHWPEQDPIGQRVRLGFGDHPWLTVVGVAGDVRSFGLDADEQPSLYVPHAQRAFPWLRWMNLAISAGVAPESLVDAIRAEVWAVDPDVPLTDIQTGEAVVADSLARRQFTMSLLALFAGLAVALASVGLYGVLSYAVGQQTREIGIRMVLGADPRVVVGAVMRNGVGLTVIGLLIGLGGALAVGRVLESQLYGVQPTDPVSFAAAAVALITTAFFASLVPARRATRVDPMAALRTQ